MGTSLCNIWYLFLNIWPFYFEGHNFLKFVPFLMIFSALDAPIGGVQVFLDAKNKWSLLVEFGLPWALKCYSFKFLHVQSIQTLKVDSLCFFQMSFFKPNVQHSFWKLEKNLKLMIRRAKRTWLDEDYFHHSFEHIWLKNVFDLENYGFWKCGFTKSYSYICDRGHECIIYTI